MPALPTGTVTFLFTDIEGSTRLLQHLKDAYADVLVECRRLVHASVQERGGHEVDTEGGERDGTAPFWSAAGIAYGSDASGKRCVSAKPVRSCAARWLKVGIARITL